MTDVESLVKRMATMTSSQRLRLAADLLEVPPEKRRPEVLKIARILVVRVADELGAVELLGDAK